MLASRRSLRVLIVEDDVAARETLAELVAFLGHEAWPSADGKEALARAERELPDVCLVDIGLPDMDGNEVAQALRRGARGREMRLIALTGHSDPTERQATLAAGFDDHVVKPVSLEQLRTLLLGSPRTSASEC
jgi:CheY-like chemotaxis protein